VALESLIITSTIDAFEGRDIAILDVPGAFMMADMDAAVNMCLTGRLSGLLVKTTPDIYWKYISLENKGNSILYVKLQKVLDRCLRGTLLFYIKLAGDL
jgi:hypothetical protein